MMKVYTVTVTVREWFDKVNGNTYQSVKVHANGTPVGVVPFRYGHGDGCAVWTAQEILRAAGFPVVEGARYEWTHGDAGVALVVDVAEVARRKDLHMGWNGEAHAGGGRGDDLTVLTRANAVTETAARLFADGMSMVDAFMAAEALEAVTGVGA
jgi:hypothetical protein